MISKATVTKIINENTAEVQVERLTACGHSCETCGGGCSEHSQFIRINANINGKNIEIGDIVKVSTKSSKILKGALIMYILPVFCFFFGYFLTDYFYEQENIKHLGGVIAFIFSISFSFLYSKNLSKTINVDII